MKKNALIIFISLFFSAHSFSKDLHDWTLQTQNGKTISLNLYKDKPIILHFWQRGALIVKNYNLN